MKQQWHSGFDDSSGWGRLIDPVCLFILCQIAGTLWVITPRKAFNPPVAPNAAVDIHRAEVTGLTSQKSALEKAVKLARQELATLALPVPAAVTGQDRLAAQIRTEEQQAKELEAKLGELARKEAEIGARIGAVPPPSPQLGAEAEQLGQQLASRQTEIKRLQLTLERTRGPGDGSGVGSPRIIADKNLKPVFVHVIGGRALPVDSEHYDIKRGVIQGTQTRASQYSKSKPGETADEIRKPNSKLEAYLKDIDTSKQYLLCYVEPDSFQMFREVRKFARERGIQVGWDPTNEPGGTLTFTSAGGSSFPGPQK
jgi:hypothetical protein